MRWWIVLGLLAACGGDGDDAPLIEGSPLIELDEGDEVVLAIADGVTLDDAPAWVDDFPTIHPPCTVVPGHAGTLEQQLTLSDGARRELVTLVIHGARTGGCAPLVTTWIVDEVDDACGAPPDEEIALCLRGSQGICAGSPLGLPGTLCARTDSRDPADPIWADDALTTPTSLIGDAIADDGGAQVVTIRHPIADNRSVAGEFEVVVSVFDQAPSPDADPFTVARTSLKVGHPGEALLEVVTPLAVEELGVASSIVVPWSYPSDSSDPPATYALTIARSSAASPRGKDLLRLSDADTGALGTCTAASCTLTARRFALSISPAFDALPTELLEATLDDGTTLDASPGDATKAIQVAVASIGDDLDGGGGEVTAIACRTRPGATRPVDVVVTADTDPSNAVALVSTLYVGWPAVASATVLGAHQFLVSVTRHGATPGTDETAIYGASASGVVEELGPDGWGPTSGFPVSVPTDALGPIASADGTVTEYLARGFRQAGSLQIELHCIDGVACPAAFAPFVLGSTTGGRTIRELIGFDVDEDGGDDLVVEVGIDSDGNGVDEKMELREVLLDHATGTATVVAQVFPPVPAAGSTDGPGHGLARLRRIAGADDLVGKLGPKADARVYLLGAYLRGNRAVLDRFDAPSPVAGVFSVETSVRTAVMVASKYGVYDSTDDTTFFQADPVHRDTTAPGALVAELDAASYGQVAAACASATGGTRAVWLVSSIGSGTAAIWKLRIADLDSDVAGPWPD